MAETGKCLVDKVALITGASSGIGAGTAVLFAKLGASLALTGRQEKNLASVGTECEKHSQEKPLLLTGDLCTEDDVKRIVEGTMEHFGRLNILVNNAGIFASGSIQSTSMEQFDRVFNINCRSVYHLTMLCAPHLCQVKGSIVNVSSLNGIRAFASDLAYCMSKASVDQMTRCVALELASKGVRCNAVNPGVTVTEVHKRSGLDGDAYTAFLKRSETSHPLGRVGHVDDVASAIAFLASDEASFITGVNLPIDGGRQVLSQ